MEITEVRIKLMDDAGDRLRAFCSITFDNSFVVRDLKIIEGTNGLFVAMPSRKLASRCPDCGAKNHLRAAYCNQCGVKLKEDRAVKDENGRAKLYADIAHPINSRCRERIQSTIIESYQSELVRAREPGYVSTYDDYDQFEETGEDYADSPAAQNGKRQESPGQPQEAHAQPAEKLQGPHESPPRETAPQQAGSSGQQTDDFGAGILD